jgi:hypothetical protein
VTTAPRQRRVWQVTGLRFYSKIGVSFASTSSTKEEIEQTAEQAVDAMLKVHRALGPGLLESTDQGRH